MKDSITEQYKLLLDKKDRLPSRWQQFIPKEQPKQIRLEALQKEQIDFIPSFVRTRTLCKAIDGGYEVAQKLESSPIILVFCQPAQQLGKPHPYVPVSYCSWLESAGARCVPLPYNINEASMEYLMECSNGLLVPGGNSNLYKNYETKEGYGDVTVGFRKVWRCLLKMWSKGVHFPIWGTCLGLELVLMMISEDTKVLSTLNSRNHTQEIFSNYEDSVIFRDMPVPIRVNVENKKILNFFHRHGISVQRLLFNEKYQKLRKQLKLISASRDKDGTWFCSFLQGTRYPIFLSQFHPQKQAYEWNPTAVINHNYQAVEASQYFSNQFVQQCRKCPNKFPSKQQQFYHMIYQFIPQFEEGKHFQTYLIDLKYRKNRDLKNPKLRKSNNELPAVNKSVKKIEEQQASYS